MTSEPFPVRRLRRILALLAILHGRTLTANELAKELGVSRRTIFRDLAVLRRCGYDIVADPVTQRLRLAADAGDGVRFAMGDKEQLLMGLALAVAGRVLPGLSRLYPLLSQFAVGGNGALRELAHLPDFIHVPPPEGKVAGALVAQLARAYLTRTSLRVTCRGIFDSDLCITLLSPYQLKYVGSNWEVVGRSSVHRRVVSIPLSAVQSAEPTEYRYAIPPRFGSRRGAAS